jgi:hypothetical protein
MASDLTTLENVKEYLGIKSTTTTDDALLQRLIAAASAFLLKQMNRQDGLDYDYEFTKGIPEIPADVEFACCELVALRYKEKERIGEVSKNLGGQTVSYSQKDISDFGSSVINNYKRVTP